MNGLEFWSQHGRAMTLRERIEHAVSLAELEDIRRGREDVARICRQEVWPDGEGNDYTRRKAELGKREAGR